MRRELGALLFVASFLAACGPSAPPPVAPTRARATPPPAPVCPPPAPQPSFVNVDEMARAVVAKMNAKDSSGLFALFAQSMQESFPLGVTTEFVEGTIGSKGAIKDFARNEGDTHNAVYTLHAERGDWRLSLHLDDAGHVSGMRINDAPPPEPPVVESPPLALPMRGKWLVAWGGTTAEDNPHLGMPEQRRAADLVMAGANGKHFKTDGKKNEDFLAFGQDVLAVADGTVLTVVDGVPDNSPGQMNPGLAYGNVVIVDHGKAVFSVYAHLEAGKIKTKPGQKVKAGAALGVVGNSGNSSEPHLHMQIQDGPRLEGAWGIEGVFARVMVTRGAAETKDLKGDAAGATQSERPERYTFKRGDVIESVPGAK